MTSGNARIGIRNRIMNRLGPRLGLAMLGAVGLAAPLAAAIGGAWFTEAQLADDVTGAARVAYVAVAAVVALAAVDSIVCNATRGLYRRLYASIHGPRTWSCEDCGASINADRWTPDEAATFEELLADPAAHRCTGPQQ